MLNRESGESRKKQLYGIRLNPKCLYNGQSATKPRIEEGSTTNRLVIGVGLQAYGNSKW